MDLFNHDRVLHECSCGLFKPILDLYFCKYCFKLRCKRCAAQEVDSLFCSTCMSNLPTAEASMSHNRCANCRSCPVCTHTLSVRATTSSKSASVSTAEKEEPTGSDGKEVAKKFFFLVCGACRWSSRDANIPDQTTASGGWPELADPDADRISALTEAFSTSVILEREDIERAKRKRVGRFERFRLSSPVAVAARKRAGLPPLVAHQRAVLARAGNAPTVKALEAPDSIPPLPEDTWTEEVNLSTISTLKQRFQMPAHQPQSLKELSPRKQVLRIRRSMRCRHCEHNLCKLEYYPTSCKFKIQLNAFYHIPEIRMSALPSVLRPGGDISFILTVRNPTQYDTTIKILPFDTEPPETELPSPLPSSLGSPPVPPALTPCPPQQVPNCFLVFPLGQDKVEVLVPARNEVADFDPTTPKIPQEDESSLIVWKDTNKVALKLRTKLATEPGTVARLGLVLAFDYISAMVAPGCQQVQCPVYIKTQLNLGNIAMASS